jgi:hypothetical protein
VQKFLAIMAILLSSTIAFGQTINMDEKVVTQSGRMASITIKSDGDDTTWTVAPPTNVDVFREYDPNPNVIKLRVLSYTNGAYYVIASTTLNKKVAQKVCVVIVGTAPDPQPQPDPTPNADAQLIKNLKAVFAADSDPDKANQLEALTSLYEQGTVFTKTRADLKTYGQLWQAFQKVADTLGCHGKLKGVQQIIANEMQVAGIPTNPADGGTTIDKEKVVAQLQRITALLKAIK